MISDHLDYNALGLLLSTLPIGFDTYQMVYIFLYINSNSDTCIMSLFLILYCGLCLVQDDSELNFKFDGPSSRNSTPPVKQDRKDKERERLVSTLSCLLALRNIFLYNGDICFSFHCSPTSAQS